MQNARRSRCCELENSFVFINLGCIESKLVSGSVHFIILYRLHGGGASPNCIHFIYPK